MIIYANSTEFEYIHFENSIVNSTLIENIDFENRIVYANSRSFKYIDCKKKRIMLISHELNKHILKIFMQVL